MMGVTSALEGEMRKIADEMNDRRGYNVLGYMGEDELPSSDLRIPTGCAAFDRALHGGYPVGRIIELFGWESAGKSTVIDHALIECQRMGGVAVKIDQEHSHHQERFERMGGDAGALLVLRPMTVEQGVVDWVETVNKLKDVKDRGVLARETPVVVAWDTLHAAPSASLVEGIKEGNYYAGGMANKARTLQDMFRFCTLFIPLNNVLLLVANQMTHSLGGYGASTTTSGGNALKFYSSVRLQVKKQGTYKEGDDVVGITTEVNVVKNKVDPPLGRAVFPIRFDTGIDDALANFMYLHEQGYISKRGAWYTLRYNENEIKFYEKDFREKVGAILPDYEEVLARMVNNVECWQDVDGDWIFVENVDMETGEVTV